MGRAGRVGEVSGRPVGPRHPAVAELLEQVRDLASERVAEWFPEIAGRPGAAVDVHLMSSRPSSALLEVTVTRAGRTGRAVVKVRREALGQPMGPDRRPGLAPPPLPPVRQAALEWAGLCRIADGVAAARDPGVAAARPLAHLADLPAVALERVDAPTGRRLMEGGARLRPGAAEVRGQLTQFARHAGRLVRICQVSLAGLSIDERDLHPAAVASLASDLADYLGEHGGRVAGRAGRAAAVAVTLTSLAPGCRAVGHGDFALRNTFRQGDGRVLVIDPMPRWRTGAFEDLARFAVSMRLQGAQVLSQGLLYPPDLLDRAERALLDGYADGDPLETGEWLAWYLLVLLDKWAALVSQRRTRRSRRTGAWVDRYVAAEVARALRRAERAG